MFDRDWHFLKVLKLRGVRATCAHLTSRLLGEPRYLRPSSTTDFRGKNLTIHQDLNSFLITVLAEMKVEVPSNFTLRQYKTEDVSDYEFPVHWNSGEGLSTFLFNVTLILKPDFVVETGTANGASAAAICAALRDNGAGLLYSFDISEEKAYLVKEKDRDYFNFCKIDGSPKSLNKIVANLPVSDSKRIFLHDADHSYFGQMSDYSTAASNCFDLLVSDDVDASLAFTDFAGKNGHVFLDGTKFIGARVLNHD